MKLAAYLKAQQISDAEFAGRIKVSQATVNRYINAKRIPHREVMSRIVEETDGEVTPNDFFPADEAERAA